MTAIAAPPSTEPQWLLDVRLRSRRRMLWVRELWSRHRYPDEQSLAITHSEVELALAARDRLLEAEQEFYDSDETARALTADLEALADSAPDPRWQRLCSVLGLASGEQRLLALCLSAEIAPGMRRVYGYLQDDTRPVDPTPALVADLWGMTAPPCIRGDDALVRWALARPVDSADEASSSSTVWIADPLALDQLLDGRERAEPAPGSRWIGQAPVGGPHQAQLRDILHLVSALGGQDGPPGGLEIELIAPAGAGRTTLAAQVAAEMGRGLLAVDSRAIAAQVNPTEAAARAARVARMADALVVWQHADRLEEPSLEAARRGAAPAFLTAEDPLPNAPVGGPIRRSYALPALTRGDRLAMWSGCSTGEAPEPVAEWALRPAEIRAIANVAPAGGAAIKDVSRRMLLEAPDELLARLPQPYTWNDFVVAPQLAAHLREFEAQASGRSEVLDGWGLGRLTPMGRGVTALFAGPSGTGKTMAAQVLARSLGLELYRVDLAGVVNKYIGETEKHLRTVFAACERAPVMLFFDEADALFGRRMQVNDAHDRFANIEVDYLLQRMEQFDGVAVLATNRKGDLDTAFMRRLRFTIDFAPPTIAERERLWRLALEHARDETGSSLVADVDWAALAEELDLTGAGIKSAALGAAFLARTDKSRIETRHLLAAARRELEKQGVVVRAGRLEAA